MRVSAALAAAALGTAMGTFVKTEAQAGWLSTLFGKVMLCWALQQSFFMWGLPGSNTSE